MIFKVSIRYVGDWEYEVEAKDKRDAREKAKSAFAELTPWELGHFITDSSVDDCYQVDDVVLTEDEFNALNKIATATKMDCWFHLESHNGFDYVYDLENDCRISVFSAVRQLLDGMVEPVEDEFYKLTEAEIVAFKNLVKYLGITN